MPKFSLQSLAFSLVFLFLCGCKLFSEREVVSAQQTVSATGQTNTVYQTNIVYSVNPGVSGGLDMARGIAGQIPGPYGAIAFGVIGLASTGLTWLAKRKSDKQAALVPALITGIESAPGNEAVKASVKNLASAAGLEEHLNAVVRELTK